MKNILVTGAAGFIGHHLVDYLKQKGDYVRGVDWRTPEHGVVNADEFLKLDLRYWEAAQKATDGMDEVYALAADMGGMGFISRNNRLILENNSLINIHTMKAAREAGVQRYLYTSSACVYPVYKQQDTNVAPLKETDAYPAQPEDSYGWEKLVTEILAHYTTKDDGMETRVVRFHNIFGPEGTWAGGREKAPAALSRKVALSKITGDPLVKIWGDGEQTRSFCYIDDCVTGLTKLMRSEYGQPLNLGQDRMIAINDLAYVIADLAGTKIDLEHVPGPQGVRGRNSDNTLLREVLGWEPEISLEEGLQRTYSWINSEIIKEFPAAQAKLKEKGLPINVDNLEKYFFLTHREKELRREVGRNLSQRELETKLGKDFEEFKKYLL